MKCSFKVKNFFFISKGVFPKIWGHPTQALLTQHFFPSDESNSKAKQLKSIHSFNCFIKPASPWIIYVAPQRYVSTLSYLLRTLQLLECLALFHSNNLSLHPSTFSLVYLSACFTRLLLDISFSLNSFPPFFQHVQTTAGLLLPPLSLKLL